MDKAARIGIRMADLLDREIFEEKLLKILLKKIACLNVFMKQKVLKSKIS